MADREERTKRRLLEDVRIASPCDASWDAMKGTERVRFCGECQKNVYNLSEMTRGEAEALLEDGEPARCWRLYRRADGTVITKDCPVGVERRRRRLKVIAMIGAGAGLASALSMQLSVKVVPRLEVERVAPVLVTAPARRIQMGK